MDNWADIDEMEEDARREGMRYGFWIGIVVGAVLTATVAYFIIQRIT